MQRLSWTGTLPSGFSPLRFFYVLHFLNDSICSTFDMFCFFQVIVFWSVSQYHSTLFCIILIIPQLYIQPLSLHREFLQKLHSLVVLNFLQMLPRAKGSCGNHSDSPVHSSVCGYSTKRHPENSGKISAI